MATRRELLLDPSPLLRAGWARLTRDDPTLYDRERVHQYDEWLPPTTLPRGWPPTYRVGFVWQRLQYAIDLAVAVIVVGAVLHIGRRHQDGTVVTLFIVASIPASWADKRGWSVVPKPARAALPWRAQLREVALVIAVAVPAVGVAACVGTAAWLAGCVAAIASIAALLIRPRISWQELVDAIPQGGSRRRAARAELAPVGPLVNAVVLLVGLGLVVVGGVAGRLIVANTYGDAALLDRGVGVVYGALIGGGTVVMARDIVETRRLVRARHRYRAQMPST